MLYVGLMNSFKAVSLDQLDDTAKTGLHIGRQPVEFTSHAIVEQLYDPSHAATLLHFCNVRKAAEATHAKIRIRLNRASDYTSNGARPDRQVCDSFFNIFSSAGACRFPGRCTRWSSGDSAANRTNSL